MFIITMKSSALCFTVLDVNEIF